jgi:hypothetical protein
MEEKEPKPNAIKRILQRLSDTLRRDEHADVGDSSFEDAPIEVYASPEEGARLIRAFMRISRVARRFDQAYDPTGRS